MKASVTNLTAYTPEKPLADLEAELGLPRVIRLSANENPYGTSPKVGQAVRRWASQAGNRYPDGDARQLRALVASRLAVDPDQLVFGVGLDEIIELVSRTFLTPGDQVLLPELTFSEYALHAKIEAAELVTVSQLENGQFDFAGMLAKVTAKTKLVWLCNPNNPTGTYETVADIEQFVAALPTNVLVLIDEAYIEYVTSTSVATALALTKKYANVVIMRTLSKVYGCANYRIGFAVFAPKLAAAMQKVRLPYNLNSVAQTAAIAALKDQDFVKATVTKTTQERDKWQQFLKNAGLRYFTSQTNFVFFQVPNAASLQQTLLQQGYLVRTGLKSNWIRVTIGEPADNQAVQKIIAAALKKTEK